eukprot:7236017-Pyramimonas_sp.AAC.1
MAPPAVLLRPPVFRWPHSSSSPCCRPRGHNANGSRDDDGLAIALPDAPSGGGGTPSACSVGRAGGRAHA